MFINSKKCFEIREGDRKLVIPRGYIGSIPDWVAEHWLIQAAIRDGSIATPGNSADRSLEEADGEAKERAEEYDIRPEELDGKAKDETAKPENRLGKKAANGKE